VEANVHETWQPPADRPLGAAEAPREALAGRTVAVIGYGTMGRAHGLNLRDSGVAVLVGARAGSARGELARSEGFTVLAPSAATARAEVVMLMLPDEAMQEVFAAEIAPHLAPEAALGFAHGFAVAFGQVDPGARACFLVAPKSQGDKLRESFQEGGGAPGLLAVTDASPPGTWALAAAYAGAVGCLHGGGWRTTFREECIADQFGEQAVLCGGVIELLQAAFETLVERGYDRTNAYFECVHELALITDLLQRYGLAGMRQRISPTAAYGGLTRGPRVIDAGVRARLGSLLAEIEAGDFAREFLARHDDPRAGRRALAAREAETPLAQAHEELRALAARHQDPAVDAGAQPANKENRDD
jgi:ketol-acid reductoisomerase